MFGKVTCFRLQVMMVELGKILGFPEAAGFRDF